MNPSRDEVLTVEDVSDLPNGRATILRVATDPQYTAVDLAVLDDSGYLRSFDERATLYRRDKCTVVGVEQ